MRKAVLPLLLLGLSFGQLACSGAGAARSRRLPVSEYRDKMTAGWIGQMAGVAFGAPTEFACMGRIMPAQQLPQWRAGLVNDAFGQDDLYVEMTFLRTLEQHGLDASTQQAGRDWANSQYGLAHANNAGRANLRRGVAATESGHPRYSRHSDDIDFQIESDFSGLVAPGLPNTVIALGDTFGHLMNYGDGVYAGQFVGAMYAEAFFDRDPEKIARAALNAIPERSQYAEMVRDVLHWHAKWPQEWGKTWQRVEEKYHRDPAYVRYRCSSPRRPFCIEAKLNGAYVLIGLLYGERHPAKTMEIACRCGQDSDCNPSTAAGVLFTTIGFSNLDQRYTAGLDETRQFANTAYTFAALVDACEKVAREAVVRAGGRIERDASGGEVFIMPVERARPGPLEQSWLHSPAERTARSGG